MEKTSFVETPRFSNTEDELKFLRERVAEQERMLGEQNILSRQDSVRKVLTDYQEELPSDVLEPHFAMSKNEAAEIVLHLSPELHDTKMEELIGLAQGKGIHNALRVLSNFHDPHLEDDFHRFLVAYLSEGYPLASVKERTPLAKSLKLTLFQIEVPDLADQEKGRGLKELLGAMEQWYAGMAALGDAGADYFALELAVSNSSKDFIFYAAVPTKRQDLFEKQLLAIFPKAQVRLSPDDYNIFNPEGVAVAAEAMLAKESAFPLKTYDLFESDPMSVLIQSFSKIDEVGEGAAIQLIFSPTSDFYLKNYEKVIERLRQGSKRADAIEPESVWGALGKELKQFAGAGGKPDKKEDKPKPIDETAIANIQQKITSPIAKINLRLVASAANRLRAQAILADLMSSFNQFERATSNNLKFTEPKTSKLAELLHQYSFRIFDDSASLPLNYKEVVTLFHLPLIGSQSGKLKQAESAHAPAPTELGHEGVVVGVNSYQGLETPVHFASDDRLRHFYVIGQTGTGKSTLLKNMLIQDIKNGDGVCFIDPHGVDLDEVLAAVPKERYEDVIYFDPSSSEWPMGLNMLEYDPNYPEQKTFVVNEMLSIFNKLFDMKTAGGPMFEQYFRNAVLLVMDDPASGGTLLDVSRVLASKSYRELKLSHCRNPLIVQFWREVAEKAGGEAALANIVPYITSKFDIFLTNDIMRPIVAQEKSSFNFREIMDGRKILLVNLAKGRLGDINAHLIGLILVGKILMAALSRVGAGRETLPPFYLYLDEFQNITTDSIATILSEARKYKLSLVIAHQFIAQLEEKIRDAVFGNVGSLAAFRVGSDDAEYLTKQFAPTFTAPDLMNVPNRSTVIKLLVNGRAVRPFDVNVLPPPPGNLGKIGPLKELSALKYGRERAEVERGIMAKYQSK